MPPERLSELRRQRDLIRAHLHWLDSEIAGASAESPESVSPPAASKYAGSEAQVPNVVDEASLPMVETAEVHNEVRRGCLIYAAIVVALGIGLIAFIYWRY